MITLMNVLSLVKSHHQWSKIGDSHGRLIGDPQDFHWKHQAFHWSPQIFIIETLRIGKSGGFQRISGVSNENFGIFNENLVLSNENLIVFHKNMGSPMKICGSPFSNNNLGVFKRNLRHPMKFWGYPMNFWGLQWKSWSLQWKSGGLKRKFRGLQWDVLGGFQWWWFQLLMTRIFLSFWFFPVFYFDFCLT